MRVPRESSELGKDTLERTLHLGDLLFRFKYPRLKIAIVITLIYTLVLLSSLYVLRAFMNGPLERGFYPYLDGLKTIFSSS
jgi:hypothetical protein